MMTIVVLSNNRVVVQYPKNRRAGGGCVSTSWWRVGSLSIASIVFYSRILYIESYYIYVYQRIEWISFSYLPLHPEWMEARNPTAGSINECHHRIYWLDRKEPNFFKIRIISKVDDSLGPIGEQHLPVTSRSGVSIFGRSRRPAERIRRWWWRRWPENEEQGENLLRLLLTMLKRTPWSESENKREKELISAPCKTSFLGNRKWLVPQAAPILN